MGNLVAKLLTVGAVLAASAIAHKATDSTWKFVTGSDSPANPEDLTTKLEAAQHAGGPSYSRPVQGQ